MSRVIRLFTLVILLASCASTRQYVEFTDGKPLDKNKGRIYVIKPSFVGSAVKVAVFCDNRLIGNATNGSYLAWDIEEGEHIIGNTQFAHAGATLGSGKREDLIRINVKRGKTYYLKISPRIGGMDFKILSTKKGERLIKGRKKPRLNYIE